MMVGPSELLEVYEDYFYQAMVQEVPRPLPSPGRSVTCKNALCLTREVDVLPQCFHLQKGGCWFSASSVPSKFCEALSTQSYKRS